MHSTKTTPGERKVILWFFGPLLIAAAVFVLWMWRERVAECSGMCTAKGYTDSALHFNKGGRFDVGTYCECSKQ